MQSLIDIQQKLKAPKGQYNSFGGYAYRSCEDILEAIKPLLGDTALKISDEIVLIGDRYYIKSTATLHDKNGKEIATSTAFAREEETKKGSDAAQITGAASSYARKYALNGLFLIDDTKDPDSTNTHGKDEPKDKAQFAKDATANKRATTVAINKAIAEGKKTLPPKAAPTSKELEDKSKKFDDWFNGLGDKAMSTAQIDYVNEFIAELDKAGLKVKSVEVREKMNKKLGLDDFIPEFGEDGNMED